MRLWRLCATKPRDIAACVGVQHSRSEIFACGEWKEKGARRRPPWISVLLLILVVLLVFVLVLVLLLVLAVLLILVILLVVLLVVLLILVVVLVVHLFSPFCSPWVTPIDCPRCEHFIRIL